MLMSPQLLQCNSVYMLVFVVYREQFSVTRTKRWRFRKALKLFSMIILTFGRGILLWGSEIDLMTYITVWCLNYLTLITVLQKTDEEIPEFSTRKHIKPLKTSILDLIIMHSELRLRRSLDMKYTLLKDYGTEYYIHVYMHDLHWYTEKRNGLYDAIESYFRPISDAELH